MLVCVTVKNTENRSFLPRYHPQHLSHPHQITYAIENNHHLYSSSDWVTFFLKKKKPVMQNIFFRILTEFRFEKKKTISYQFHQSYQSQNGYFGFDLLEQCEQCPLSSVSTVCNCLFEMFFFPYQHEQNKTVTDIRQRCISSIMFYFCATEIVCVHQLLDEWLPF